jgi:hypothetical protein
MTAGDNPLTTGQPSLGGEGVRLRGVAGIEDAGAECQPALRHCQHLPVGSEALGEMGRDWSKVTKRPSGTGPWMVSKGLAAGARRVRLQSQLQGGTERSQVRTPRHHPHARCRRVRGIP